MNRLHVVILTMVIMAGYLYGANAEEEEKKSKQQTFPSFSSLKEAVSFISYCLDKDDYASLAKACTNERKITKEFVLRSLKAKHQEKPLPERYNKVEFPKESNAFKLGGHASELGHIHIDFVKRKNKWFLDYIWVCR
jgi:hypothetical protein